MLPIIPQTALVANGEILSYEKTQRLLAEYKKVIAVDGGLEHCHKMNITPDLIIGDFDSVPEPTLRNYTQVPVLKYPKDKDESDLELAIKELLLQGIESIALFGVTGKRVDHLLYTLYLLARYPQNLVIVSAEEKVFCLSRESDVAAAPGQTLSLIPLNKVLGVTTEGLQWELSNATLDKTFMSLSNVSLGNSFKVRLQAGDLLCCLQNLIQSETVSI
jgi:thiamine pyrophosphokinase